MRNPFTLIVSEKAQDVYVRCDTQIGASKTVVLVTAANQKDGSVFIKAKAHVLEAFLAWCNCGPELANVTSVVKTHGAPKHYISFDVLAEPSALLL